MRGGSGCQTARGTTPPERSLIVPSQDAEFVEIFVNGDVRSVAAGATVLELLGRLELDPERLAVELNRSILKKDRWADTRLSGGESLEIVQFVGGG